MSMYISLSLYIYIYICISPSPPGRFLQEKLPDKTALPAMLKEVCQQAQQALTQQYIYIYIYMYLSLSLSLYIYIYV